MGIIPGHTAAWTTYARAKEVEFSIAGTTWTHTFADKNEMQWVPFPSNMGTAAYSYGELEITIKSVYPGKKPNAAISEIQLRALSFDG